MPTISRSTLAVTLALLVVGLALLQPVSGQPGQWRSLNPVFTDLNDVWMISSSQGWAVGDSPGGPTPGTALYWDGTRWQQVLTPDLGVGYDLLGVACVSATRCLAVGASGLGPVLLQWDGTAWVDRSALVPLGTIALLDIHIRSDGLGFAVGAGSPNIIRIPDANALPIAVAAEFTADTTPGFPFDVLWSVWLLPPGGGAGGVFGFAVGDADSGGVAGTTWRWDGSAGGWNLQGPGSAVLRGVHVLAPTAALAVGDTDDRTRWNGATWALEGGVVIAGATWRSTFMVSATDQWIVGDAVFGVASIARWNGVAWSAFAPPNVPVTVDLNSIYMVSASDGWAVGDSGTIIRWNGSSWNSVASPAAAPNDIRGVWLASTSDGWAVGDALAPTFGQIFRWNGANWNFYQSSPVAAQLNEIHGSASNNVLAVGNDPDGVGGIPPVIIQWTGGPAWVNISPAGVADGVNLNGVFAVSPTLAFAVGDFAAGPTPATMLRWDGTVWGSIGSGTAAGVSLRSVWMVSSTDGWAVGDGGTIVRWNGAAWAAETSPPGTPQLNAVQALTSTNVWAVGNDGAIIHRDGTGWSTVASGLGAGQHLTSLYMLSATEGWAVGITVFGLPIILFWNGLTWSWVFPIPVFLPLNLEDVWMVASQDGWAVGQDGLILRFGPTPGPVTTVTTVSVTATTTSTTTTTQTVTATSTAATSTVSTVVTSTSTQTVSATTTTFSTVSETTTVTGTIPLPPGPGIPGFPIESILAGLVAGATALFVIHRRRGRAS